MLRLIALALMLAAPQAPQPDLKAAWTAVAEMEQAARTPAEKRFAAHNRQLVATAQRLIDERSAARARATAAGSPRVTLDQVQMSFNMQYLQLQAQMQHENRLYSAVSAIMKTKHDTVKNAISNIR